MTQSTNPFSSVPAVRPDWSNAEHVFHYIDYALFTQPDKREILNSLGTRVKIADLVDKRWYAVFITGTHQWWTVYVTDGKLYTIFDPNSSLPSEGCAFVPCRVAGDYVTVVPIGDCLPPLPDAFVKRAIFHRTPPCMYVVGEGPNGEAPRVEQVAPAFMLTRRPPSINTIMDLRVQIYEEVARVMLETPIYMPQEIYRHIPDPVVKGGERLRDFSYRGYEQDVVGYVSRDHTRCDSRKSLTAAEQAKRNRKRQLAKASRKRK